MACESGVRTVAQGWGQGMRNFTGMSGNGGLSGAADRKRRRPMARRAIEKIVGAGEA
jgi:hypothetical protein